MRKVHLISGAESLLFDIALAIRERNYTVSVSGYGFTDEMKNLLKESGYTFYGEGWFPEKLTKDINFVVLGSAVSKDNPELVRAKELGLLVMSIPEFIYLRVKGKTRVVVAGARGKKTILSMVSYVLLKQKVAFDYALTNKTPVLPNQVKMTYESRIALIEGEEPSTSVSIPKKNACIEFYRPHIAVLTNSSREQGYTQKLSEIHLKFISSIEREGKLIYYIGDEAASELIQEIREDITAIPYDKHPIENGDDGKPALSTRYGKFPVYIPDNFFLINMNAARLVCRQLGVKDSDFYQAISDYSLSLQP